MESVMNAGDLCHRVVISVRRQEELAAAAKLMREQHVGFLVVTEPMVELSGERAVGVLTDRDIVTAVIARDIDPRAVLVDDVMTREPVGVSQDASVEQSLRKMREFGVRRMPVFDAARRVVGVLSLDDVLDHLAEQLALMAGSIRKEASMERALRP
jgi:CBS domain-containing protein